MAPKMPPVLETVKEGYVAGAEHLGHRVFSGVTGGLNGAWSATRAPADAFNKNLSKALNAEDNQSRFKYGSMAALNLLRYGTTFPIELAWNTATGAVTGVLSPQTAGHHTNIFTALDDVDEPGIKEKPSPLPALPEPNLSASKPKNAPRPQGADQNITGLMGGPPGRGGGMGF